MLRIIDENYIIPQFRKKGKIITPEEIEELETLWDVEDFAEFEKKFKKHIEKLKGKSKVPTIHGRPED